VREITSHREGRIFYLDFVAECNMVRFYTAYMLSNLASPGFAQMAPALVGGLLWRRGTREGALSGLVVGIVMLIIGSFFYKPLFLGFHPIVIPLLVNLLLYIGVSLATAAVPKDIERKYFDDIEDWLLESTARERGESVSKPVATQLAQSKV